MKSTIYLLSLYWDLAKTGDYRYILHHFWESRMVWWILKLIPREIKKWIVVQAAVKATADRDLYPAEVTYEQMHDVLAR